MFSKHEYSRNGPAPSQGRGGYGQNALRNRAAAREDRHYNAQQPPTAVVPLMDIQTKHGPAYGRDMRGVLGLRASGSSASPETTPQRHPLPLPENVGQDFRQMTDTPTTVASMPHLAGSQPASSLATSGVQSISPPATSLHPSGPFASTAWPPTIDARTLLEHAVATACRWSVIFPPLQAHHMLCAAFPAIDPTILYAVIRGIYTASEPFSLRAQTYGTADTSSAPTFNLGVPSTLMDVEMVDLVLDLQNHTVPPPNTTPTPGIGTPVKDENMPDFTTTM